jgi:hypothetical protein
MAHPSIIPVSRNEKASSDSVTSPELTPRQMTDAWSAAAGFNTHMASPGMVPGTAMTPSVASVVMLYLPQPVAESEFSSLSMGFDFHPVSNFYYC